MSRIGKKPVPVPNGVKISINGSKVLVEGPKGKLEREFRPEVSFKLEDGGKNVVVSRINDERVPRALHGLSRALLQNMVQGVTVGFERKLEIHGVGYLAALQGKTLQLRVGFANEIHLPVPEGITVKVPDQTHVHVSGIDKQAVGQFAAEVRAARKPEPYKGKGVRYEGEQIRRKAGKAVSK